MHLKRAVGAAALLFATIAGPAQSQDVTLTSIDGTIEIDGDIVGFDGEFYRVDTAYGVLTLDGSGVTCSGVGCPNLDAHIADLSIHGAPMLGQTLLPMLLGRFAVEQGLNLHRRITDDSHFSFAFSDPATGQEVARMTFVLAGTRDGFSAMAEGGADMVLAAREISEDEANMLSAGGFSNPERGAGVRILAVDGLVPIVAAGNPLRAISADQLHGVLSARITNWADLGGLEAPIVLHLPEPGTDIGAALSARISAAAGEDRQINRHPDSRQLADAVAKDPFAIGITRFSEMGNTRALPLTGDCGAGFNATRLSLKTEDYPLTAPMYLYTPARRLPKFARSFLRFLSTDAAQRVVAQSGFVDQQIESIALDDQGARFAAAIAQAGREVSLGDLQDLVAAVTGGTRLSLTFRFEPGSTSLDTPSRANVRQLALLIEAGLYDGSRLLFAGFSDGDGAAAANRRIAAERAEAVRQAVEAAADGRDRSRITLEAKGFGEVLPLACDDSAWGRQANRRVELWLVPAQR